MNSYMANSKLFLTDNNYQSYQSFTIKIKHKNDNYWTKIGKIGNYCQFKHQRCEFVELTLIIVSSASEMRLP